MTTGWEIRLLGGLSAARGEEVITHFRTQKTAALFAFLAYRAGAPQPREELIELFWPDSDLDQGRMSLRTALSALRKTFGSSLAADTTNVTLTAVTDLQQFLLALRGARNEKLSELERVERLRRAVDSYGGPLLPGLYDDWVLRERDRLASAYVASLTALSRWHGSMGEMVPALDYARRAAAADPLSEEVRADLIRLLLKANLPADAVRQFQDLERLLEEQVGAQPTKATRALVAGLHAAEKTPEPECIVKIPTPLGRFRGRQDEISTLVHHLSNVRNDADCSRLFTLFGPGGIGKTRLAIETARRLAAHRFYAAIHFVPLAAATTLEQSWEGLAGALGLSEGNSPDRVRGYLASHAPTLLIFDNLEQVLPDGAALVESLLTDVPGLTVLATSRRRLAIAGEELFAVGALPIDDAMALYVDRARGVEPGFKLTPENQADVRALAESLEGFPLAIELAAAWAAIFTPGEIRHQLEKSRLALPEDIRKEPRHASLTAAILWSIDLLEPELRQAFLSLSVFRGGWDADAAQSICGAGRSALASLRDRSLLLTEAGGASLRFTLHESLREFGQAALRPEEWRNLLERHAGYFLERAEGARLERPRDENWADALAGLTIDEENLRAARERSTTERLVRLTLALAPLWAHLGRFVEGEQACSAVLAAMKPSDGLTAPLTLATASLAYCRNDNERAEALLRVVVDKGEGRLRTKALLSLAQLALFNRDDVPGALEWLSVISETDPVLDAQARFIKGAAALYAGDMREAEVLLADAEVAAQEAGDLAIAAQALNNRANALHQLGDLEQARQGYEQALALREKLGLRVECLRSRVGLANVAAAGGDFPGALAGFARAGQEAAEMGDLHSQALALGNQAAMLEEMGKSEESLLLARQSLRLKVRLGLAGGIATSLNNIAGTLTSLGELTTAAQLHGAADTLRRTSAIALGPAFQAQLDMEHEKTRQALGMEDFKRAFSEGQKLSLNEATSLALTADEAQ
jgi:predicted ATPase/DNA-binding SARP family transcriptional activator